MRNKIHTFNSFINESKHDENLIDFKIPNWALPALINSDDSGLTDEDQTKLNAFVDEVSNKYGNANFILPSDEELYLGFCNSNDIDNLGSDCSLLYIRPTKTNESFNSKHDVKTILNHYLEAALFTDDEQIIEMYNKENPDDTLEIGHFTIHDFTDEAKEKSINDIKKFLDMVGSAADGIEDKMIGHDFWLTRNGHGAGFFDRNYEPEVEKTLMDAARELKVVNLYITDDNKIDIM